MTCHALPSHPHVASPAPHPDRVQEGRVEKKKKKAKAQWERRKKAKKAAKKMKVVGERELKELKTNLSLDANDPVKDLHSLLVGDCEDRALCAQDYLEQMAAMETPEPPKVKEESDQQDVFIDDINNLSSLGCTSETDRGEEVKVVVFPAMFAGLPSCLHCMKLYWDRKRVVCHRENLYAKCNHYKKGYNPYVPLCMMQELADLEAADLASTKMIKTLAITFISSVESYTHLHSLCKLAVASPAIQEQEIKDLLLEL
ncbi:hypothetical protein FQN51_002118 [Onygenales sp. PD_10]|nr:hypothetical protein FQN51_002118 [Onygenales sp. PD_10]